jgi:hypothetical protein
MGKIYRDMTAEEQALYDEDSNKFPWLKTITMSDDEFFACIERDKGKGIAALLFHHLWNRHYSWVFLAILKHFYETGEFIHYDWNYMDSQTEYLIQEIMLAWGADWQTIDDVLDGKAKFDFSKHTAPTNVPPYDRTESKELRFDYIFDEYYREHGFDNPFTDVDA